MSDFEQSANTVPTNLPPPRVRKRTRIPAPASPGDHGGASQTTPPREADYDVGYGKPPKHSQFKPGQSGNPKGRPKHAKGLNTIVRETLGGKVAVRTATGTKQISKIEAVLQKTLEKAMKGDARAQLELMKLWRAAVPDTPEVDDSPDLANATEPLTSADLAILEAYAARLSIEEDE